MVNISEIRIHKINVEILAALLIDIKDLQQKN